MGWLEAHKGHTIIQATISRNGNLSSQAPVRYYCVSCRSVGNLVPQPKGTIIGELNGIRTCYGHYSHCPFTIDVCPCLESCKKLDDFIGEKNE